MKLSKDDIRFIIDMAKTFVEGMVFVAFLIGMYFLLVFLAP